MGELKRILDGKGADGWPLDGIPGWVLSYLAPLNAKARGERLTELHAALLDAARTEGRGDEPVAWQEAAEPFFRLAREVINPVNGERPWHADSKDWMVVFSFAGQSVTLGDLRRAAVASPIREPEISSTGPMFILPGEDPVEYMALMRQKAAEMDREVFLEELAEAMFKVDEKHGPIRMNVPYGKLKSFQRKQYERYAEAVADAILNLAPVGLKADFTKVLPGGALDDTTFEAVEDALDLVDAPMRGENGRWLKLTERIAALVTPVGGRGEGWRPIETAPQQEPVLVGHVDFKGWQRIAIKNALGEWSYYDRPWLQQDPLDQPPTHWQPLPPPPEEGNRDA